MTGDKHEWEVIFPLRLRNTWGRGPELRDDLCELRHIGALPKFRGRPAMAGFGYAGPCVIRKIGNSRFGNYGNTRKREMHSPPPNGISEGTEFPCSPSETVSEKTQIALSPAISDSYGMAVV